MTVLSGAITAIVTALEDVPNIGEVHPYRRYVATATDAREAFTDGSPGDPIRFADVDWTRGSYAPHDWEPTLYGPATITVRLYRSLRDAEESGIEFRDTVEAVIPVLSEAAGLASVPSSGAAQVEIAAIEHRGFAFPGIGTAECHYAELRAIVHIEIEVD